jgi:hypothetical protein
MTWYPEAAATPEEDGPNFESPVMGPAFQRGQRRLREAETFSKVQREAREFHERKAKKYGIDKPLGQAHLRAARAYKESAGKLQEMFDQGGQAGQMNPKTVAKVSKAAIGFHKKQAEKHGVDSEMGQAHSAAIQGHMDTLNKAKQQMKQAKPQPQAASAGGHSSKQSPVPVPKKSEQPSGDIRQQVPPVPLQKLQQKEARIRNFGRKREGGQGPYDGMACTEPGSDREQMKPNTVFRGKKPAPAEYGPKAAAPRIHGGTESGRRRSLRRDRKIWESDDSERDRSASGLTA